MSIEKIKNFFIKMKEQKGIKDPKYLKVRNELIKRYYPEVSNIYNKLIEASKKLENSIEDKIEMS